MGAKQKPVSIECQSIVLSGKRYAVVEEDTLRAICDRACVRFNVDTPPPPPCDVIPSADMLDERRLGPRIVLRRRRAGMTQIELARRAGVRVETLNRVEKGRTIPDFATMRKLVVAMNQAEATIREETVAVERIP